MLKEVCIAARDFGPGRAQEGDIICIRNPRGEVGRKEGKDYLWLIIDESELPSQDKVRKDAPRRAQLKLDDIKAKHASLDLARVRDPNDEYQPFVNPHPTTGRLQAQVQLRGAIVTERLNG